MSINEWFWMKNKYKPYTKKNFKTKRRLLHFEYFIFGVCLGIVIATIIYNTV
jgi:hypothetical protein